MASNDDASLIEETHKERNEAIFDYYSDLQECYSEVEESETMKRRKSRSAACEAMSAVADGVEIDPVDDSACLSVPHSLISSPFLLSSARTHQIVLPDPIDDVVCLGLLLQAVSSSTSRSWTTASSLPSLFWKIGKIWVSSTRFKFAFSGPIRNGPEEEEFDLMVYAPDLVKIIETSVHTFQLFLKMEVTCFLICFN
ncbi:hypothetical protein ACFX13_045840 [Malus domestica]